MKNFTTAAIFTVFVIAGVVLSSRSANINSAYAQGAGNCSTGWVDKIDGPGPVAFSGSYLISSLTVKAGSEQSTDGNQCTTFSSDGSNGCYSVVGIGTTNVTVTKIGSGPECKDISHVEFYAQGTGSPTATPTGSPTASPSADPSATPTPTSTPADTPDPTSAPNVTPAPKDAGEVDYPKNSGSVLGASTGQVLGASTMATTGSFTQNLGMLLMVLGLTSAYVSAKAYARLQ